MSTIETQVSNFTIADINSTAIPADVLSIAHYDIFRSTLFWAVLDAPFLASHSRPLAGCDGA
jgi:hypothetical protein